MKKFDENRINDLICTAVSTAFADMMSMAEEYGLACIKLNQHDYLDEIDGKFESHLTGKVVLGAISEIVFNRETQDIVIYSEETRHSAYIDTRYGDYIDVADVVGKLYKAVCQVLEKGDICENEKK